MKYSPYFQILDCSAAHSRAGPHSLNVHRGRRLGSADFADHTFEVGHNVGVGRPDFEQGRWGPGH
jgi:hypothetical protein